MLNILSNIRLDLIAGPSKVVSNLVKGLKKIKYPFVLNGEINKGQLIYIPNSRRKLIKLLKYYFEGIDFIAGPNLVVFPDEFDFLSKLILRKSKIYIQPCEWAKNVWEFLGFDLCPIKVWATGIDTDFWTPVKRDINKPMMIYFKERDEKFLFEICNILNLKKVKYNIVCYGKYSEIEFKEIINNTSFVIWIGSHESQGIAFQEVLSSDLPVLVFDVKSLYESPVFNNRYRKYKKILKNFEVTAAPYFDSRCGIKEFEIKNLKTRIQEILDNYNEFRPREFILENLTLEKKAKDLLMLFGVSI